MTTSGQAGALIAGRYRLERPTGGGTWPEEIWQGFDETLNRPVMLRLLPLDGEVEPDLDEQVQSVVAQVARLGHPNIAQVYDVGHEGGLRYVVSEWTGGRTLGQIMSTGRQRWQRAVDWGQQIAEALAALHAVGLVDGVLGPETVSVLDDRRVKLTDVGLGAPQDTAATRLQRRHPQPDGGEGEPTEPFDPGAWEQTDGGDATRPIAPGGDYGGGHGSGPSGRGTGYGSAYGTGGGSAGSGGDATRMIPGGTRGAVPPGASADVYALGAILWTAMVGMPPEVGPTDTQGPDIAPLQGTGAPTDLMRLLQSMLAASATVRPSAAVSAHRFAALGLEARERSETLPTAVVGATQALGGHTRAQPATRPREPEPASTRGRAAAIAIGVILLLIAAGVGIALLLSDKSAPTPSPVVSGSTGPSNAGTISISANQTTASPPTSEAPPPSSSAPPTSSAPSTSAPPTTTSAPTTPTTSAAPTTTSASPTPTTSATATSTSTSTNTAPPPTATGKAAASPATR